MGKQGPKRLTTAAAKRRKPRQHAIVRSTPSRSTAQKRQEGLGWTSSNTEAVRAGSFESNGSEKASSKNGMSRIRVKRSVLGTTSWQQTANVVLPKRFLEWLQHLRLSWNWYL